MLGFAFECPESRRQGSDLRLERGQACRAVFAGRSGRLQQVGEAAACARLDRRPFAPIRFGSTPDTALAGWRRAMPRVGRLAGRLQGIVAQGIEAARQIEGVERAGRHSDAALAGRPIGGTTCLMQADRPIWRRLVAPRTRRSADASRVASGGSQTSKARRSTRSRRDGARARIARSLTTQTRRLEPPGPSNASRNPSNGKPMTIFPQKASPGGK